MTEGVVVLGGDSPAPSKRGELEPGRRGCRGAVRVGARRLLHGERARRSAGPASAARPLRAARGRLHRARRSRRRAPTERRVSASICSHCRRTCRVVDGVRALRCRGRIVGREPRSRVRGLSRDSVADLRHRSSQAGPTTVARACRRGEPRLGRQIPFASDAAGARAKRVRRVASRWARRRPVLLSRRAPARGRRLSVVAHAS